MFKILFLLIFLLCSFIVYGQEEAPQVTIIQPINGTVFSGEQIKVDYFVEGVAPKSVRVLVDDKPVQLLSEVKIGQNTAMVDVPARDCKITIIVQNEFGASTPAAVNLKRSEFIFKPTLYVLAIGVSKYANPDLHLQFAAKDAIDFSQTLLRQQGLLYEKVELKLLADENATADKIRDGLNWLQTETTYRDVAMIFMAGHGVNNNVGDFFFMPVNADIEKLNATCVGYREIKETLDANAGKMLVFMDACHSGNVLGNNQRRAAMLSQAINDLTGADNGAIVFTSSTGRQYSLENPEWNNGAFTKALLEGLNGKADLFDSKTITVNTLSSYVANRVKELTKGQQAPTTIIPGSIPDFPLAIVTVNVTVNIELPSAGTSSMGMFVPEGRRVYQSGRELTKEEVRGAMMNTAALQQYNQGMQKNRNGNIWMFAGLCVIAGGGTIAATQPFEGRYEYTENGNVYYGYREKTLNSTIGGSIAAAGAAMIITGAVQKMSVKWFVKSAVDTYNSGNSKAGAGWKFNFTGNGASVAFNF